MFKNFLVKRFNTEEEACSFLNKLEEESQDKTSYNGRRFTYEIVSFYRKDKVILVYKIIKIPFHL